MYKERVAQDQRSGEEFTQEQRCLEDEWAAGQAADCGEGTPGGRNCMCKGTVACSGTSEKFITGARAPSGTAVSTGARALSKDHIVQGLECRAKEFGLVQQASASKIERRGPVLPQT